MKEISFVHLSDIHFRQNSGTSTDIDSDLRNALLVDVFYNAKERLKDVRGVLVGGDIAFAGKKEEYNKAKDFLKELTEKLEIDEADIWCVPGNHDIDQQIIRQSKVVYDAQCSLENAKTLDDADWILDKYMNDCAIPNLLYAPLKEYNDFSAAYGCNLWSEKTFWTQGFDLDFDLRLNIRGMNSCIISNHEDHKSSRELRLMLVGQSQLPLHEENTAWVALCHHPIEFWKFLDVINEKLDKRVDIQLYGHKHEQIIDKNEKRLVISAGAAQPVRGKDWIPRYNWISFQCVKNGDDRILKVKVFPRKLSSDRSCFICDVENCDKGYDYFEYSLNIDKKRRDNLCEFSEKRSERIEDCKKERRIINEKNREVVYYFLNLSYIQQNDILYKLKLFRDEYEGKRRAEIIGQIMEDVELKDCLDEFYDLIKEKNE